MAQKLHLIPVPRNVVRKPGTLLIHSVVHMVLSPQVAAVAGGAVERFAREARHLTRSLFHSTAHEVAEAGTVLRVVLDETYAPELPAEIRGQAYRLVIDREGVALTAGAGAGLFYGLQTLLQIIRQSALGRRQRKIRVPCVALEDYPDFARRGFYHDTARGKVPTVETMLALIEDLAHLKYNEFQLYIENNYAFDGHAEMHADTDPFTAEELRRLDAACRERHIDFVPSLTSLGHFEKILSRGRYRPLAEAEPAQLQALGAPCWHEGGPWSLCVTDPMARQLLAEMYAAFAPQFSSAQFNICCDEAYDLGRVRSRALAEKIGIGQMYVDWIRYCDQLVKSLGKKSIQMWGDIISKYPELIGQLPAEATLLEWGYEAEHPFAEHCALFAQRLGVGKTEDGSWKMEVGGRGFYVAPGTSTWLTFAGRTKNACANIHNAAVAGLAHGARGILITDWGDQGHQQFLAVSLLPLAYGAAAGWNLGATANPLPRRKAEFAAWLASVSWQVFAEPTASSGGSSAASLAALAYDLGLTYERLGAQRKNASLEHFLFREKWEGVEYVQRVPAKGLRKTIVATERILRDLGRVAPRRWDHALLVDEFKLTCQTIMHTCRRTLLRQQWLAVEAARKNAEGTALGAGPGGGRPKSLPRDFAARMHAQEREIVRLEAKFARYWLARNKRSRMADITVEFQRLAAEYRRFAK